MFTHNFDPVLFDFGILEIRWYSLAYIFGILIGWWYGKKIISKRLQISQYKFDVKEFDNLISYLIVSIILGGRLGYVIFYNPQFYLSNPLETLKIWEGGMSFHGGLVGVIIGTYLFSIQKKIKTLFLLDVIASVSPIGIFLGRLANFVNGELIGKATSLPWSVIFKNFDMTPRHPSQLYEAVLEGIVLFLIMQSIIFKKNYKSGDCSCLFLIFYGVFRIISETFREPDLHIGYFFNYFSMGTILSFMMIFFGLVMFFYLRKKNEI